MTIKLSAKSIEKYSKYCGPASASAVTGFSRLECARALRILERRAGRRSRSSTGWTNLLKFMRTLGWEVEELPFHTRKVTLASWLALFDYGTWMVVTPGHVITVRDGEVVEDNGTHKLRAQVLWAAQFTETSRTVWPASHPKSPCHSDNPHAKMESQQELSRKETKTMSNIITISTSHKCACSDDCIGTTKKTFAQGHDARLVSRLRDAVLNHEMDRDEAYAELNRRAGANSLHYKLDNAITNAMDRLERKANRDFDRIAKASKRTAKIETITVDGFELHAKPSASEPNVERKVGRWVREGNITEHQIFGEDKGDTVRVFRYTDKSGNKVATTKHNNPA